MFFARHRKKVLITIAKVSPLTCSSGGSREVKKTAWTYRIEPAESAGFYPFPPSLFPLLLITSILKCLQTTLHKLWFICPVGGVDVYLISQIYRWPAAIKKRPWRSGKVDGKDLPPVTFSSSSSKCFDFTKRYLIINLCYLYVEPKHATNK